MTVPGCDHCRPYGSWQFGLVQVTCPHCGRKCGLMPLKGLAPSAAEPINTMNSCGVSLHRGRIVMVLPRVSMGPLEALVMAAYVVCLAEVQLEIDGKPVTFAEVLEAVKNT